MAVEDEMVDALGNPALHTAGRNLNNHYNVEKKENKP